MLEYFIGEIAAFFGGYFSQKTINKTISLKKWFIISYCLCAFTLITLSILLAEHPFSSQNIFLIIFGSLGFAFFTSLLAIWEIRRKEKQKSFKS